MVHSIGVSAGLLSLLICAAAFGQDEPLPREISGLPLIGPVDFDHGAEKISLNKCVLNLINIHCDLVFKSGYAGATDFKYGGGIWATRLIDDALVPHPLVRGYFLDFLGQHQDTINLGYGEWCWTIQEFSNARPDIKSIRIDFPGGQYLRIDISR